MDVSHPILNQIDIYKTIFDLSPEAIVLVDTKGTVLNANERVYEWLGFKTEDIIGKNILSLPFIPSRTKPRIIAKFTQRVLGKQIPPYEADFIDIRGEIRTGMIYATPIRGKDGKVIGDLVLADDITERKKAQIELKDSEQRYRNVVERANDGICVLRGNEIVFVNTRFASLAGTDQESMISSDIEIYIHPDELEDFKKRYRSHLSGEKDRQRFDSAMINRKGEKIEIELSASFFFYKGEQMTLLFIGDITERKKTEAELREFKTITDRANYGVAIVDLKGNLTYVNKTFAFLHGYEVDELKGKNRKILYKPEQLDKVLMLDRKILSTGGVSGQESWQTRKDGTVFSALISGSVITNENNEPLYVAATLIDITESKLAEHKLIENEEKYRTLIQNLNIGVYRINGGDNVGFLQINSAMARIFGYDSVDIMMSVPLAALYQDPEKRVDFIKEISEKGFVRDYELKLKKHDGTPIIAACSAQAEYDDQGNFKWIDGVLEDVTEKKLAEKNLLNRERSLIR